MDMRKIMESWGSDIERNKAAMCFELAGKEWEFRLDGGEHLTLSFAPFPAGEVRVNGGARGVAYDCVKISDQVLYFSYLLPESRVAWVLDKGTGLVTRVVSPAAGRADVAFGVSGEAGRADVAFGVSGEAGRADVAFGASGGAETRHAFLDDMGDSVLIWTLGKEAVSTFRTAYDGDTVSVTRPNAANAPALGVSDFRAIRINENVILQVAAIQAGGVTYQVDFVANFYRVLCVGGIYAHSAGGPIHKMFAGYGSYMKDGKIDVQVNNNLSPYFDLPKIRQFTPPLCYELEGEGFELIMDDGYDYNLRFIDGETLEWNWIGDKPKREKYLCLKGDDTTYLLSFELEGASPRVNHTFVIDRENYLVTRLISKIGTNPRYPYLVRTEYEFGAIRRDGAEVKPYPRHGFTDEVAGTLVQWSYDSSTASVHGYYCANSYRLTYPVDPFYEALIKEREFANITGALPSSDEPCTYIKIKDGLYLFTLTEANGEKIMGAAMGGFRSNTMSFLQNYRTVRAFGRAFGTSTPPEGGEVRRHLLYATYGKFQDPAASERFSRMFSDPNPYIMGG